MQCVQMPLWIEQVDCFPSLSGCAAPGSFNLAEQCAPWRRRLGDVSGVAPLSYASASCGVATLSICASSAVTTDRPSGDRCCKRTSCSFDHTENYAITTTHNCLENGCKVVMLVLQRALMRVRFLAKWAAITEMNSTRSEIVGFYLVRQLAGAAAVAAAAEPPHGFSGRRLRHGRRSLRSPGGCRRRRRRKRGAGSCAAAAGGAGAAVGVGLRQLHAAQPRHHVAERPASIFRSGIARPNMLNGKGKRQQNRNIEIDRCQIYSETHE